MQLDEFLTDVLRYDLGPHYRTNESQFEPETVHLFRIARSAGVNGVYVFRTSPRGTHPDQNILPPRSIVYVAKADTPQAAREIHCKLWNLGCAPFLIVLLPDQVRVYNTFDYSTQPTEEKGLLLNESLDHAKLSDLLADFSPDSIDSGQIWNSSYAKQIDTSRKIDMRLLNNLEALAEALVENRQEPLSLATAHALIGKYVYIRYLKDRGVLSQKWLGQNGITLDKVLGRQASVRGLHKLADALETRFNGDIFPIDFDRNRDLTDSHVALVASVFQGDEPISTTVLQPRLDFKDFDAYNFRFVPIETLSSIYELFLHAQDRGRTEGAFYTPEFLADYVLSEVQSIQPLERGMKILDPACGSGVFLVLAYRRLIELELAKRDTSRLEAEELRSILLESIYGVEREADACSVTELSLALTLLDYVDVRQDIEFKLPKLRNKRIFECDFFDDDSRFWQLQLGFDWIVGNPPWISLTSTPLDQERFARQWINQHKNERPVASGRIAEAFSWRVMDLLGAEGIVGLIQHATSLFNKTSEKYRRAFFKKHQVFRITDFANLRTSLFGGRAKAPAATFVYRPAQSGVEKKPIIHYGPFAINQTPSENKNLWTIIINESEVEAVSPREAESGVATVWKFALWGTYRDKRAMMRLRHMFPTTLAELCKSKSWPLPAQGADLRDISKVPLEKRDGLEFRSELVGKPLLSARSLNKEPRYLLSIPQRALVENTKHYIRSQGGDAGLKLTDAPHIYLAATWNHIIYSDQDFIIPPRQMAISSSNRQDADHLRALALYLRSSLVTYYIFFQVPEWGVFLVGAKIVVISEVKKIPVPDFASGQIQELAELHRELVQEERLAINRGFSTTDLRPRLQAKLDTGVFQILSIPKNLRILAREFVETRLPLNQGNMAMERISRPPSNGELLNYAQVLKDELDDFAKGRFFHTINILRSDSLIECRLETSSTVPTQSIVLEVADRAVAEILAEIRKQLERQQSQGVYVQKGLRVFEDSRVHIYKPSRLIEWTRTQALNDATDLIAEVLSESWIN